MSSTFDCLLQREQKVDYNSLFLTLACMLTHTEEERERENSSLSEHECILPNCYVPPLHSFTFSL